MISPWGLLERSWSAVAAPLLVASLLVAACGGGGDDGGDAAVPQVVAEAGADAGTVLTQFPEGIVYVRPDPDGGPGVLTMVEGPFPVHVEIPTPGFALRPDLLVFSRGDALVLVSSNGQQRVVELPGITDVVRPSLSPEGNRVVVQAADGQRSGAEDLNIYIVSLEDGTVHRVGGLPWNEESPEWVPGRETVLYSSFSPTEGVNAHVYDIVTDQEVLLVDDAGAIHLAVSPDGERFLDPGRLRLYDLETGELIADLQAKVLAQLGALGYDPDTRFPGQANRGTFPLDGDFSPDGNFLVFDGAVQRGDEYGVILLQATITGDDLTVLVDLLPVDPAQSNNHNFSQLTPIWIGQ